MEDGRGTSLPGLKEEGGDSIEYGGGAGEPRAVNKDFHRL